MSAIPPRVSVEAPDAVRPTRAEIDLGAIAHNVRVVREHVRDERGDGPRLYGVVKADAYGHGAERCSLAMAEAGIDGLCVALVEEGVELRQAGVKVPVLVLSGLYGGRGLDAALAHGLTPVIYDPSQLAALERAAPHGRVTVHLKVDSGMGRLGVTLDALPAVLDALAGMKHVTVEGLMTHFANADCDDPKYTATQWGRFTEARAMVARAGLSPTMLHAAASAAAMRDEETRLDMVRVGIALYGVTPFPNTAPGLLPAMRLRTEVIALRELAPDSPVGYAGAWRSGRRSVVATIPIGYGDGFMRRLSSSAEVLIRGQRCAVVGNVSMDLCSVDVTELARAHGVSVGDEVVLLGAQTGPAGFGVVRAEEVATRLGTIPYEVLTAVSRRVPRAYRGDEASGP